MARLRVGLLGGSFNPAHDGHRHISLLALRRLGLDQVWWLVSPQNPLKSTAGMAPLAERMAGARAAARHPAIKVTDIERRLGTRFTADTLVRLRRRFPDLGFVWLMGADNLVQVPKWQRWTEIFTCMPVAVFDRPSYSYAALAGKAATRSDTAGSAIRACWPAPRRRPGASSRPDAIRDRRRRSGPSGTPKISFQVEFCTQDMHIAYMNLS